jgi:CBS domain-containing protein
MPNNPPKTLEEILALRQGVLHPGDSVQKAADTMRTLKADALPVTKDHRLVGMLEEQDSDRKAASHGHDPKDVTIEESMKRDVVFCYEDEECEHAYRLMEEHKLQNLPVLDRQQRVVGMLSRAEIEAICGPEKHS